MGTVSDSTLQLVLKKLPLLGTWCCIIKEYPQWSKTAMKMHCLNVVCVRPRASVSVIQHNTLQQIELSRS